ncbi:MAG: hypothetical protein A2015_08920 [Spirochaetes bacterium GWF1_31_7]|nr:MAG: hypothetical protein A2Y30_06740 [Spirochaetes bacterium GWE1_32_154]OHD48042.1 MAG: hypothetical protein A2015_08920 [Spirochaetes bacterium GWF1_31_7]OHD49641.1 MAG: hypothetical protein A2Y29_06715 [Spirochaetes bacterium GWE2_31_10]
MKINIKFKILIMLAIPFISIIYFGVSNYLDNVKEFKTFKSMRLNISQMTNSSFIIHQLQIERGRTSLFLNKSFSENDLKKVRENTNTSIEKALTNKNNSKEYFENITTINTNLLHFRKKVDANSTDFTTSVTEYTNLISVLMNDLLTAVNGPTTKGVGKNISAIIEVEIAKENLGLLRGYTSGFISSNKSMNSTEFTRVTKYFLNGINFTANEYLAFSNDAKNSIQKLTESSSWLKMNDFYLTIVENYRTGNYGIDSEDFFLTITTVIDQINAIRELEINKQISFIAKIEKEIKFQLLFMIILSSIIIILTIIVGYGFSNLIAKPLKKTIHIMEDISKGEGDLTTTISITSNDELSLFALHFNNFIGKLRDIIQTAKSVSEQGLKISHELANKSVNASNSITDINKSMNEMKDKTDTLDTKIKDASGSTKEITGSLLKIVDLIEDQASAVNESSASIEEMAASIVNVAKITNDRKQFTDQLAQKAKNGDEGMNETLISMNEISQGTEFILDLIGVINEVAEKTDLLAMNAAIEAAHAGDAGKGFAVVADEIRNLAEATKQKSGEISKSLHAIADKVNSTLKITQNTSWIIGEIITGIIEMSNLMNETLSSMNEMQVGSDQIIIALKSLVEITENVRGASEEIKDGSLNIQSAMENVTAISTDNRNIIHNFARGIESISGSIEDIALLADNSSSSSGKLESELSKFKT